MKKRLTIIHTTLATTSTIPRLIKEMYPNQLELINIMDDSLLNEINANGYLTKGVIERFIQFACIAEKNKSDAILLACSSIGTCADIARKLISIPIFKIDEPMADKAVMMGTHILVLGTVKSTLEPTSELIRNKKRFENQSIVCQLISDVFPLYKIDQELHDKKIASIIQANLDDYDVIVLAQASMANAIKYVENSTNKVLTSIPLGLHQIKAIL